MTRSRALPVAGVVVGAVVALYLVVRDSPADDADAVVARSWDPLPRVVTVEVWNGGGTAGAARDAALRLRRARLDVVAWGNAPDALQDSSIHDVRILVRRGDTAGAGRVAEVLGATRVIDAPDARRLVDLTVVIP